MITLDIVITIVFFISGIIASYKLLHYIKVIKRVWLDFQVLSNNITNITKNVESSNNRLDIIQESINKITNIDKIVADVELEADKILMESISYTTSEDLKRYLSYLRTAMVNEYKRTIGTSVENWNKELIITRWQNIRGAISNFASTLPEFIDYEITTKVLRDEDLVIFADSVFEAKKFGNGSFLQIFSNMVKDYITRMLKFTVVDFIEFRSSGRIKRLEAFKGSIKHNLIKALEEADYQLVFEILKTKLGDITDIGHLSNAIATYNRLNKDLTISDEGRRIGFAKLTELLIVLINQINN